MKTRRSSRNQQRLYKAIGRELAQAAQTVQPAMQTARSAGSVMEPERIHPCGHTCNCRDGECPCSTPGECPVPCGSVQQVSRALRSESE